MYESGAAFAQLMRKERLTAQRAAGVDCLVGSMEVLISEIKGASLLLSLASFEREFTIAIAGSGVVATETGFDSY